MTSLILAGFSLPVCMLLQLPAVEPIVVQQSANWTSIIMAVIAAIPATIAAIVGGMALLQSKANAEVAARTDKKVDSTAIKADTIIEKATEIHTLTNSNLSKVQSQLDVANEKIDGFNKAQGESARKIANMEQLIMSLVPAKGQHSSSQINGEKLDTIKNMLTDVQHGTPPIPVKDEAVLAQLKEVVIGKLDTIQESADAAAKKIEDEKKKS